MRTKLAPKAAFAAETNAVLFPAHAGVPHAGRVVRKGTDFSFVPLVV